MTPQLVEYKYAAGDRWQTLTTTSMVMHDPQEGQSVGQVKTDQVYEVLAHTETGWKVLMMQRLQSQLGPLAEGMPKEQGDKDLIFGLDRDGTLSDLGQGLPSRLPCFPAEPVGQGMSWNVTDTKPRSPGLPPLTVTHVVAVDEERDGERTMDLVLMCDTQSDDAKVSVQGTATFAVARGRMTYAITKIEMEWADGRRMETALEIELAAEEGS